MNDIRTLWTSQKTEETVTLENVHEMAAKFQRYIYRRNTVAFAAQVLVIAIFGWYVWVFPGWMAKLGSALVIAAVFFGMWQFFRRGSAHKLPEGSALALLDFHRRELERRRDFLRSYWSWFILPLAPGLLLMLLGRWYQIHVPWRSLPWDREVVTLSGVIVILGIGIIVLVQRLRAMHLQRQIDELDKLK